MIQSHNKVFLFVKVAGFLQELRAAARERESGPKDETHLLVFHPECVMYLSQLTTGLGIS